MIFPTLSANDPIKSEPKISSYSKPTRVLPKFLSGGELPVPMSLSLS